VFQVNLYLQRLGKNRIIIDDDLSGYLQQVVNRASALILH
jgi:hypothetical protein